MWLAIKEVSFINITISVYHGSESLEGPLVELTLINVAICVDQGTGAVWHAVF